MDDTELEEGEIFEPASRDSVLLSPSSSAAPFQPVAATRFSTSRPEDFCSSSFRGNAFRSKATGIEEVRYRFKVQIEDIYGQLNVLSKSKSNKSICEACAATSTGMEKLLEIKDYSTLDEKLLNRELLKYFTLLSAKVFDVLSFVYSAIFSLRDFKCDAGLKCFRLFERAYLIRHKLFTLNQLKVIESMWMTFNSEASCSYFRNPQTRFGSKLVQPTQNDTSNCSSSIPDSSFASRSLNSEKLAISKSSCDFCTSNSKVSGVILPGVSLAISVAPTDARSILASTSSLTGVSCINASTVDPVHPLPPAPVLPPPSTLGSSFSEAKCASAFSKLSKSVTASDTILVSTQSKNPDSLVSLSSASSMQPPCSGSVPVQGLLPPPPNQTQVPRRIDKIDTGLSPTLSSLPNASIPVFVDSTVTNTGGLDQTNNSFSTSKVENSEQLPQSDVPASQNALGIGQTSDTSKSSKESSSVLQSSKLDEIIPSPGMGLNESWSTKSDVVNSGSNEQMYTATSNVLGRENVDPQQFAEALLLAMSALSFAQNSSSLSSNCDYSALLKSLASNGFNGLLPNLSSSIFHSVPPSRVSLSIAPSSGVTCSFSSAPSVPSLPPSIASIESSSPETFSPVTSIPSIESAPSISSSLGPSSVSPTSVAVTPSLSPSSSASSSSAAAESSLSPSSSAPSLVAAAAPLSPSLSSLASIPAAAVPFVLSSSASSSPTVVAPSVSFSSTCSISTSAASSFPASSSFLSADLSPDSNVFNSVSNLASSSGVAHCPSGISLSSTSVSPVLYLVENSLSNRCKEEGKDFLPLILGTSSRLDYFSTSSKLNGTINRNESMKDESNSSRASHSTTNFAEDLSFSPEGIIFESLSPKRCPTVDEKELCENNDESIRLIQNDADEKYKLEFISSCFPKHNSFYSEKNNDQGNVNEGSLVPHFNLNMDKQKAESYKSRNLRLDPYQYYDRSRVLPARERTIQFFSPYYNIINKTTSNANIVADSQLKISNNPLRNKIRIAKSYNSERPQTSIAGSKVAVKKVGTADNMLEERKHLETQIKAIRELIKSKTKVIKDSGKPANLNNERIQSGEDGYSLTDSSSRDFSELSPEKSLFSEVKNKVPLAANESVIHASCFYGAPHLEKLMHKSHLNGKRVAIDDNDGYGESRGDDSMMNPQNTAVSQKRIKLMHSGESNNIVNDLNGLINRDVKTSADCASKNVVDGIKTSDGSITIKEYRVAKENPTEALQNGEEFNKHDDQVFMEMYLKGLDEEEKNKILKERKQRIHEHEMMLKEKKLCLVLDLDHTLLNSAKCSDISPEFDIKLRLALEAEKEKAKDNNFKQELYHLSEMGMWTKLRPGIWKFLRRMAKLFELHVYTMGNRAYATEIMKILDPIGELFCGRVTSRGDEILGMAMRTMKSSKEQLKELKKMKKKKTALGQDYRKALSAVGGGKHKQGKSVDSGEMSSKDDRKVSLKKQDQQQEKLRTEKGGVVIQGFNEVKMFKDLDGVLGMESGVLIVDDSSSVWPHHASNLIVVERYMYFPGSRKHFGLAGPSLLELGCDERETDGMLASALSVIESIHASFFETYEKTRQGDVRDTLVLVQKQILAGCRILFSRIFPVGEMNHNFHPLWRIAEQLGASCTTTIDENVTHVVALAPGTDKVNWGIRSNKFVVKPSWLEASAALYKRANEQEFRLI